MSRVNGLEQVPNTATARARLGITLPQPVVASVNPKNLMEKLRAYQQEDALFLSQRRAVACFNQQRTGKTPTSLTSLRLKGCKKVLIVCPASMVPVWQQEFEQWYEAPCIALQGTKAKRTKLLSEWTDGLVIGYECLRVVDHYDKETGNYSHSTGDLADVLRHKDIDAVIVDEAHRFRNYKSKTAQAIFKLSKIPNRLALTGTPAIGGMDEIFSILKFLYPKLFRSYWRFIDFYFDKRNVDIRTGTRVISTVEVGDLIREQELQELLDMISTQRKRIDVMPWLPDKVKQDVHLKPTKKQKEYIKSLKEYFEVEDIITYGTLDTLIRERQICLSPALLSLAGTSPKLDWLKQYQSDYPDKQVIVFSKFTQWLELLDKELKNTALYTGNVASKKREQLKQDFQRGKVKWLLIQIDAGKEGLTLDMADTIIFTDRFPPIGDIEQAEDRFVATAQHKVKSDQIIYNLILDGTYEVKINKALEQRATELDLINDYKKYLKGDM